MNLDNDYDSDGNNIVPCPICLNVYCPSKEDGKCPEEDEYIKSFDTPQRDEEHKEEWERDWEKLFNSTDSKEDLLVFIRTLRTSLLHSKAEELLREIEGMKKFELGPGARIAPGEKEHNKALTDIEHLIRTVLEKK